MGIVGALDLHRRQITFRWQDVETREIHRGRIAPAARQQLREWLAELPDVAAHFALEGTTGWRFVVEELEAAGRTPPWPTPPRSRSDAAPSDGPRSTTPTAST